METTKELSTNCSETENIYSDIIEFDLGTEVENLREENELLEDHIDSLKKDIEKLADALQQLKVIQNNLAENISSLFLTAKMELTRKDHIIDNLQKELNDIIFRRDKKKRKSFCSSPVHLSKRGRYDDSYNSTDCINHINENNQNYVRCHEDKESKNPGRDHELKNDFNTGWGSRVNCRRYHKDDEHNAYKDPASSQQKSYGRNIDDKMRLQNRQETRSSNHDRNHNHNRNDDSHRTRRNVSNTPSTDHKKHWIDESNRKCLVKTEEKFGRCSNDNEQDVQNECSRIPKVETIKLEKEPIKDKFNKSNTENKKPVRKKYLIVQNIERELMKKRALTSQNPSVDLSRNKAKSNENRRRNYFVDHMDHIMDTVLLNINEAKEERNLNNKHLIDHYSSDSEDEENSTMDTHNQLSFENVPTISDNLASELTDIKMDREKKKCVPCDYVDYNLLSSKADSETVLEPISRTLNENKIKIDEQKSTKIIDVNNDIISSNELPAQSAHEKRKRDQVIEDELNLHVENVTEVDNGDFEIGEEGTKKENWENHYLINSSSSEMNIAHKLSQISRETLEINNDECVKENKSLESLCHSRSKSNHDKTEGNDIITSKFAKANNEYLESLKNQKNDVQSTNKDSGTPRKTTDMGGILDKHSTRSDTEAETGTSQKCIPKDSQEDICLHKRRKKLTPSRTLPKLNSQYKIPKKTKKFHESEPSETNNACLDAQRNLVLISSDDHMMSYDRMHKDTDSKNERFRKGRRKSVPRSFLRSKLEETDENIRSKSRDHSSRDNNCERQTETGRQHNKRYISSSRNRIDYQRDNYTRIKRFSRESLKSQERRRRNRHIISEKNSTVDMKHSRMRRRNYVDLEHTDELTKIKASLCSQKGRKYSKYSVTKDSKRIHHDISKKDQQTIFLEKDEDFNRDTIHPKNENTREHKELQEKITEIIGSATKINYSVEEQVEESRKPIYTKNNCEESLEKNPAEQESIANINRNYAKIPQSIIEENMHNTDGKVIEEKFLDENVGTSIKDSLNEQKNRTTDVKNLLDATPLETTGELYAVKNPEKVNITDSLNEMLLKPVSSKTKKDLIFDSKRDVVKEKLGGSAENSSQKKNRENGKLPIGNISIYSLETNSTKEDSEMLRTVPSIEETELKGNENMKRRSMPDILSQDRCGQIMPNLIPLQPTSPTDQHLGDSITTEKIKLSDKNIIHCNSVQRELADNKEVEEVIEEKEKQLPPSETDSLEVLSKVDESFEILGTNKNSNKEDTESNLHNISSSELKIGDGNIPVISERSSYQKVIESSPFPAKTLVRKRITPIRVDDTPLCSFENILVKNRMPSFVKDLTAPNESPLSLTHEGDIPLLHLEENNFHISNDDGTQKSFDRNIMNLLDTMNMSNLECDMTKFQDSSEKYDRSSSASESGPNHKSDNGAVLEPSIEKQTLTPVSKSEAVLTSSTEPLVISTSVDTNNCINKSISGNGVQNCDNLRTPTSNSGQNLSMVGRRRSVRLVVINSV